MPTEIPFYLAIAAAALCIGISKAGFSGVSMLSVAILAEVFGARESVGIGLPMLIAADLTVYPAFRKWGSWKDVWGLLLPMLVGIVVGFLLLKEISNEVAKPMIGVIIAAMLLLQIWKKWSAHSFKKLADSKVFGIAAGTAGGIATTLANAAGPVIQLFLLSRKFSKMEMVGIGARLFLIVNLVKVPLLGGIDLITKQTLLLNLFYIPVIWLGIWLGKHYLLKIPQRVFEVMILAFAFLAAVRLLFF